MMDYKADSMEDLVDQANELLELSGDVTSNVVGKSILEVLILSRNIVKKIFKEGTNPASEITAVNAVNTCLKIIKPYTIVCSANQKMADGTSILQLVNELISFIVTKYPPLRTFEQMKHQLENGSFKGIDSDDKLSISFNNINTLLGEMKELLQRSNGDLEKQIIKHGSFWCSPYILRVVNEEKDFMILRRSFEFGEKLELSGICHNNNNFMFNEKYLDVNNPNNFESYIELCENRVEFHTKTLSNKIYDFGTPYLKNTLSFTFNFLSAFESYIRAGEHVPSIIEKITSNLDGLTKVIYSLPLLKVLKPQNEDWILQYLDDVSYNVESLLTKDNYPTFKGVLWVKLTMVWFAVRQLHSICLKQFKPLSLQSKLLRDYRHLRRHIYGQSKIIISEPAASVKDKSSHRTIFSSSLESIFDQLEIETGDKMNSFEYVYKDISALSKETLNNWKPKFSALKCKNDVLHMSLQDSCYICNRKFDDIMSKSSKGDLAVIAKCLHLMCLDCLEKVVIHSGKK